MNACKTWSGEKNGVGWGAGGGGGSLRTFHAVVVFVVVIFVLCFRFLALILLSF